MVLDNNLDTTVESLFGPARCILALSFAASLCFIVAACLRWHHLRKSCIKIGSNQQGNIKAAFNLFLLVFQSSIVGLSISAPIKSEDTLVEVAHLVAVVGLVILSPREHHRSVSPSTSLVVYLSTRTFFNVSALLLVHDRGTITIQVLRTIIEAANLVVESQNKKYFLLEPFLDLAPEETAGPWSKASFAWVASILFTGKDTTFSLETLPQNPQRFNPSNLRQNILLAWDQRAKPENRFTLPSILVHCLMPGFATVAITRFMLIVFRYAQPLLISRILQLLAANALSGQYYQLSCTIVIISTVVYIGQAIVSSSYRHELNRLEIMTKAALIELVYENTLNASSNTHKDYSAVTVMSTDVDALEDVSEMFHESWAQVLEVIVGMILLAQQIGWFCIVPLPMIYGCSHMTRYVARNLRPKQLIWNKATQNRINRIVSVISKVKIIKMLGLTKAVARQLSSLRQAEIDASKDMRWVTVLANASANALGLFTPTITIVLFAAAGSTKLDAETAYTTLAVLTMVTHPANMIMTIVPRAISSLASFQRIQDFISKPHFRDVRLRHKHMIGETLVDVDSQVAVEFEDVELKLAGSANPTLENVNLRVNCGSVVVCTGSTGVGKSVLGLAVAGEITPSKGSISTISKRTGLCVQSPWLPGQSVSETIQGSSRTSALHNDAWYQQVLDACCIDDDILLNPAARDTGLGLARLSGGQRQRVALARAVYQRHDIIVLDDPFSALDQQTQDRVIANLLGPDGLLKKSHTTVFLITNATRAYPFADKILVLKDKRIQFDGGYSSFHAYSGSLPEILANDDKTEPGEEEKTQLKPIKKSKLATKDEQFHVDSGPGDISVYRYYLQSVGATNMLALLACTALFSFFSIFPQYWIKWWTEAGAGKDVFYMLGYLLSSTIAWAATSGTLWVNFIKLTPRSGTVLHSNLLSTVMGAPLSYFINNDIGKIVNRFSQDIKLIDRDLPSALAALCTQIFKILMQCSLLLASQRLLLFTLPIYCFLIYFIQKVYLRTSRQLRYLELESKSAVYSSFLETVEGLVTIRAFGWQKDYLERNTRSLDLSQRACYLFLCLQRWLNVTLDLAVAFIAIIVISLAVFYSTEDASADVGIALNMVLVTNTTLLRLIGSWTTLEVSVGAAARLKELEDRVANEEDCAVETVVPRDWPTTGSLTLKGVRVCYGTRVILEDVDLDVQAGKKVFICGETGSGKSTLITALLRLCQVHRGSIQVDGIEISQASPSIIRERCFIAVPQDASNQPDESLRNNLDPLDHHSAQEIKQVLQRLHLWTHFEHDDSDPVDDEEASRVLALPLSFFSPLSVGQTQLLSLACAILRARHQVRKGQKPIILLDEPAANLDNEYESLSSRIIEEEFTEKGHTVQMITHSSKDLKERVRPGKDTVVRISNGTMSVVTAGE